MKNTMNALFKKYWLDAIAHLAQSTQNRIITATIRFQLDGTVPTNLKGLVLIAMSFIIKDIDPDFDLSRLSSPILPSSQTLSSTSTQENTETAQTPATPQPNDMSQPPASVPETQLPAPEAKTATKIKLPPKTKLYQIKSGLVLFNPRKYRRAVFRGRQTLYIHTKNTILNSDLSHQSKFAPYIHHTIRSRLHHDLIIT